MRTVTPARTILVTDAAGHPLVGYDLYIYRCSHPGSQFSRAFSFPGRREAAFELPSKSEVGVKRTGGAWVAPDFYISHEPELYWVACVNKRGYRSRRWSLNDTQVHPIKIVLHKASGPGDDYCDDSSGACNPCRSYEYDMYGTQRYRHSDCNDKER